MRPNSAVPVLDDLRICRDSQPTYHAPSRDVVQSESISKAQRRFQMSSEIGFPARLGTQVFLNVRSGPEYVTLYSNYLLLTKQILRSGVMTLSPPSFTTIGSRKLGLFNPVYNSLITHPEDILSMRCVPCSGNQRAQINYLQTVSV